MPNFRGPKKGEKGEASLYYSRNKALKYLQLKLHEFRKLTVWKGIYPREPKSRKKAQHGDTTIKTLYLKEDIKFLAADPLIRTIREEKVHREKVRSLKHTDRKQADFVRDRKKPKFVLDHVVLERYPTFGAALEDMSDPLTACFIYATLAKSQKVDERMVFICRNLTIEFMNYIIQARCLRKTFITIKGYFYRAHIQGHKVSWMVPHTFAPEVPKHVDMGHLGNFIKFYMRLLSFVNFKLYSSINLHYPPTIFFKPKKDKGQGLNSRIRNHVWSLNTDLKCEIDDEDKNENFDKSDFKMMGITGEALKLYKLEKEKAVVQKTLFEGVKFFLGRETNRESLTFVIRSAGGLVSWDSSMGAGFKYSENHKEIKYQIVDRPSVETTHLTRYYVQPQWVYDSFNAGILMPVQDYFVGVELPAHLSPFEETYGDNYVPPEMTRLQAMKDQVTLVGDKKRDEIKIVLSSSEDEEEEDEEGAMQDTMEIDLKDDEDENVEEKEDPLSKMKVWTSKPFKRNREKEKHDLAREDWMLRRSFIHRKQRRLFKKLVQREQRVSMKSGLLKQKRILYEKDLLKTRKTQLENARKEAKEEQSKMEKAIKEKKSLPPKTKKGKTEQRKIEIAT